MATEFSGGGLVDGKVHTIEQEWSPHICGKYSETCLL